MRHLSSIALAMLVGLLATQTANAAEGRVIEEITVTAEKRESTVSDTSISISAFDGQFLEDFGIRNQEDLASYIPATTIQPYDLAVRGVGRSFRALGGDPGISTYLNGVYSEDFGIASTEGGLFDIERIEVLRGPQGTLYGRNSVGGAVNFISKKPSMTPEGEFKTIFGDYGLREFYGVISGPIIEDKLAYRFNGINRSRDGYYEDVATGGETNDYGDENYSLSMEWTPTDNFSILGRANERSYRRVMGAAGQTAGAIVLNEAGLPTRDTQTEVFGYRPIISSNTDSLASTFDISQGAGALAATGNAGLNVGNASGHDFLLTGGSANLNQLFRFTNPKTGESVIAQRVRPGIDPAPDDEPNRAFGLTEGTAPIFGNDIDGDDLQTATNGLNDEFFDHQAASVEMSWDVTDSFRVKYIYGYTDYFYDRTTDRDLTGSPFSDETFYVSQENENEQHELQFYFDFGERATLTSGLFFYKVNIDQRGDFYSAAGESRYADPVDYGALTGAVLGAVLPANPSLFSAREAYNALPVGDPARNTTNLVGDASVLEGTALNGDSFAQAGLWRGDGGDCSRIPRGPVTCGSFVEYATNTDTTAFAFYNQAELFLTEKLSLTLGIRYAKDEKEGEENVFLYTESNPETANFAKPANIFGLAEVLALAAIDSGDGTSLLAPGVLPVLPTGNLEQFNNSVQAADPNALTRYRGVPFGVSFHRPVKDDFDDVTWRVNIDYEPNDNTLLYAGVTTGFRAGGFNLANLSDDPLYPSEEITAYEIGWKDKLLDGTLQINMSAYFYDYENIHLSLEGQSSALGASVNNVRAAPEAEVMGFEAEVLWLATDRITLGGNFSYTDSEYTKDIVSDLDVNGDRVDDLFGVSITQSEFDPSVPGSIFSAPEDRTVNIKGNSLLLVPEIKYTAYAAYLWPLNEYGTIDFRTTVSYQDEVFFTSENNPEDKADEYYRWDARVTWTSADQRFVVSGFVNNILDEIGIRQISRLGEEGNYLRAATVTDPRLFGIELAMRFGQ